MTRPNNDVTNHDEPSSRTSPPTDAAAEIVRLNKVVTALMNRVERNLGHQGSAFDLFQTALTLEDEVQERTQQLESALEENEQITQNLYQLTADLKAEIQQRKLAESQRAGQYDILEMITANEPLERVFAKLTEWVEAQGDIGMTSLLLLAEDGETIGESIGPSLPAAYSEALLGLKIGPSVGSCGTAMYRKEMVVVRDIESDPLWSNYRGLVAGYGLRACWSTPITTTQGEVLGSFAVYNRTPYTPTPEQKALIAGAVHLAGIAIERSRAEARIHFMAHHDDLTELPNRVLLEDQINKATGQAWKDRVRTAVLMIDLDRFKDVNDSLGHHVGDLILKEVSDRLQSCVRSSDTIARLGGDEFVISIPETKANHSATGVAADILKQLETPFLIRGKPLQLGASIGISVYPEDGDNAQDLLRAADTAMYAAKKSGRNQYHYFTHELNQAAHERIQLLSQLQNALKQQQFRLVYQPQYRLSDDRLVGGEALLRWQHPERGQLTPGEFLFLLEEHGLIADVGAWVLRAACAQAALWHEQGATELCVAVNFAADQFHRGDIVQTVSAALTESGLDPKNLVLEFTENVLLQHSDSLIASMNQLKQMGVHLSLDDFGTGYSSLAYLHRYPVDELKIDQSFIHGLNEQTSALDIVNSIVNLASSLDMQVVAEGIETEAQKSAIMETDCHYGQGYLVGRPVSAEAFTELLAAQAESKKS